MLFYDEDMNFTNIHYESVETSNNQKCLQKVVARHSYMHKNNPNENVEIGMMKLYNKILVAMRFVAQSKNQYLKNIWVTC